MERQLRVLVVEDMPDDAEMMILALRRGGLDPTWKRVETADELAAALAEGPWDAVLSDYTLPKFGATAALEVVRSANLDLPFLVVSGTVGEEVAVETMRAGANDYVLKHNLTRLAPALDRELREADNRRARKRADEAMRASETRYRRLFEAAQDGILIVDPVSRQILDANPFLTALLGYDREELAGKELWQIGLFRDIKSNKEAFQSLQEQGYIRYDDLPLKTKDGRRIEVEFVSNTYDVADALVIQCNIRDITERKRVETLSAEALRASEAEFRTLVEAVPQIVWITRPDGWTIYINQHWMDYTGLTLEEGLGRGWSKPFHPEDQQRAWLAWQHAVATSGTFSIETRLRRVDGVYHWWLIRGVPLRDAAGTILKWFGTCTDIDELKQTEIERDKLLARLQLHIERLPLAYILFDADFRITDWNPAAERTFGYTRAEALCMSPFDLAPPSFQQDGIEIFDRIRAGDMTAHSVNENLTKDGRTITCEWYNTPLTSEGGQFTGLLCLAQDITARRDGEAALQLRDRAIQAVMQGILITDPCQRDNPIVYASPGFLRLTGYAAEEVIGRNCRLLQGKDTDPAAVARVRQAIEVGQSCTVELLNYRKNGAPFWNELSISPVRDSAGRLTHFIGVQTDVTARRSLEEQLRQSQKMEAFGQLAGGVAHDFNNLLTIINGYSEFLGQSLPKADPSQGMIAEILKAGKRSAGLTRQLLAFSRQQVLAPRLLKINEVVVETEKMLRRLIGEDIRLVAIADPWLWIVRADPGQIEQVLLNLAVNARDAMPEGGRLTIETQNVDLDAAYVQSHPDARVGPHVVLSVTDTGTGMSPEVRARIFEPFYTTKEPGKGTGLGLATVYGIIQQSGGHLTVSSEVGVGTTFKVYLPRAEQVEESKSRSEIQAPPLGTETILLVEDEEAVRTLTCLILAGCGYTVLEAGDGDKAMRVAAEHHGAIHLLVTDVVMPGLGGRVVAEQLTTLHPGIRVLFMSGYTGDTVIRQGVLREAVNFLQKPFSPAILAVKVREVLDAPGANGHPGRSVQLPEPGQTAELTVSKNASLPI